MERYFRWLAVITAFGVWSALTMATVLSAFNMPSLKINHLFGCASDCSRQSSYVKLADSLHAATTSVTLEDNRLAAEQLLERQQPGPGDEAFTSLLTTFTKLKGTTAGGLCGKETMASISQLSEAMRREGNQGAKRMTEPVRRLNQIIVRLMTRAQTLCFGVMAGVRAK